MSAEHEHEHIAAVEPGKARTHLTTQVYAPGLIWTRMHLAIEPERLEDPCIAGEIPFDTAQGRKRTSDANQSSKVEALERR